MAQDLFGSQPLGRRVPQQATDQALGSRRDRVGDRVLASSDLREERARLDVVEGVAADEHCVGHHAETPRVGGATRVAVARRQDLGADIRRTAMLVHQAVVVLIFEYVRILQTLQLQLGPTDGQTIHYCHVQLQLSPNDKQTIYYCHEWNIAFGQKITQ